MEGKTIIIRQEPTKEVIDNICRIIRKIATKLPPEKADKLFYTDEELKEINAQKKDWIHHEKVLCNKNYI